jgi:hypothetical protein
MPNYSNGIIYEICNDYGDYYYVGSSCVGEDERMYRHYDQTRRVKSGGDPFHVYWNDTVKRAAGVIGKGDGFHINVVKVYPCNSRKELWAEEYRILDDYIARGVKVLNDMVNGKHSDQARKKMSISRTGKTASELTKNKMSVAQAGVNNARFNSGSLKLITNKKSGLQYWQFRYNQAKKRIEYSRSVKKLGYLVAKSQAMAERLRIYPNYVPSETEVEKHRLDILACNL